MSVFQVQVIVGSPGTVLAKSEIAGYRGLVLSWDGEDNTDLGANAIVQFQDGSVITKAQFGL